MPRILAIDWDRHEARGLLLATGPTGMSVSGAWAVPLTHGEYAACTGREVGERLAAAIAGRVAGKVTTLVAVGRDNLQMQLLSLPPAPTEELPELVRFQAEREFTSLGDDAALDFIHLAGDAQTPHRVLAVALTPAGVNEAREVCSAIGVEPSHIVLRACAAASLVLRAGVVDDDNVALIVNPLTDEADLIVQAGRNIVLMRTVRIPDVNQSDAGWRALVGEIRRTMAAVRQQMAVPSIDQIVVCGARSKFEQNRELAELEVPVLFFDVASQAPAGFDSQPLPAQSLSRFAAVLGMALNEADRRPPIVDFANVRRRSEPRRFTRVHALAAAAAAVAALWLVAHLWRQTSEPARELAALESRIRELEAQADMYKDVVAQAAAVERWLATDVNWLDELEQFARRLRPQPLTAESFPVEDDIVVTQLTLLRPAGADAAGGRIDLKAKAKNDAAVSLVEQRLRDERRQVTPGGIEDDSTVPGYSRAFDLQVHIPPPDDTDEANAPEAAP